MPAQSFTSLLSKANPAPALNTLGRRIKSVVTAHVFKPKKSVGAYADTLITSEEKPPTHAAPPSSATLPQTPVNLSPLTLSKRSIKAAMASHTSFRSDNQTLPSPTSTAIYTAPLYEEPTRESLICLCTVETRSVQVPYNPVTDGPCQELPAPVSAPTDTCPSTPIFGFNPAPTPIPEACPIYKMVSTTYIVDTDDVPLFFLTLLCPTRYNGKKTSQLIIKQWASRNPTKQPHSILTNSSNLDAL
ncbi:hypothetical protein BJ085DRAFT_40171 [Dimargaris cristalligena]|uniref:Uncharacterized protein n=1 Tax=Dimargaris cristalligena TaxID=215637 RepID=A0A4P9ZJS8_9FUNG|nr:hypothetical protein BJ085DRAFT_40171 [Dimargaris cristalligena]|eukprot:RKP33474.1 hypothetical protein BJ085DRAFT_40171 [Dimargaris cristalligena]